MSFRVDQDFRPDKWDEDACTPPYSQWENRHETAARKEPIPEEWVRRRKEAFHTDDEDLALSLTNDVVRCLPDSYGIMQASRDERVDCLLKIAADIGPEDGLERILVGQLLISHSLFLDVAFHASYNGAFSAGDRDVMLRGAQRLNAMTVRTVDAISKLRREND